jgi:hypothetical protein
MTWTKLSDDYADDCYTLSDAAYRLHNEGLVWQNRKLTDLRLEKDLLPRWATRPEAADELVAKGFWTDEGDHYLIRHHAMYQRTREQVLNQQVANKRNGARGGKAPRERFSRNGSSDKSSSESLSESLSERDGTGQDRPLREGVQVPTRNGNGCGPAHCRYCDTELPVDMASRGYCDRAGCRAEAKVEMS